MKMYDIKIYKKKKKKHKQYEEIYIKWYYVLNERSPQYNNKDRTIII